MHCSTLFLVVLGASTYCFALPRRTSPDEVLPQPVLPEALREAVEGDDHAESRADNAATSSSDSILFTDAVKTVYTSSSTSFLDSLKTVYEGLKVINKLYIDPKNDIMNKIMYHLDSLRIIKHVRDGCTDEEKKSDLSCTEVEVHGFPDFFGDTWHKISTYFKERYERITDRIDEKVEKIKDTDTSTVVAHPDTYFGRFLKFLNHLGLDGKPVVVYDRKNDESLKKEPEKVGYQGNDKSPQQLKDDALDKSHLVKIVKHNYWTKAVNSAINLAGIGVFAALCAQNCGIENLLGVGTPLPPLDPEDEAANEAAALADAAGDTDGDLDVDEDDGRRRNTVVLDSYLGYDQYGEYVAYNPLQPQGQPDQKNYFIDGHDPGYAPGTYPGWYSPDINIKNNGGPNNDDNNNHNNNHLLEPSEHPDFSSRLGQASDINDDDDVSSTAQRRSEPILPRPVFRGGRMLDQKG